MSVNGRVASLGASADPTRDTVALDGEPLRAERLAYWVVHKPRGVVTTRRDPEGRRTILELLPPRASERARLVPVGRLDLDSEGLVLLTNDGALTERMLHPRYGSEKEYRVTVRGVVDSAARERLERGVHVDGRRSAPLRLERLRADAARGTSAFHVVLREGRNRQIRRMLASVGVRVDRLVRVRVGPLRLAGLARGAARPLTAEELRTLRAHVAALVARPPRGSGPAGPGRDARAGTGKRRPKARKHLRPDDGSR